jgi:hypothetical protein
VRIIEFLENIPEDRQMRIKGEDFMTDPDPFLIKIAEWLGISTDAGAIGEMKHPENSPFACYGPSNAKFGNDPSYLEAPELRKYEPREYSLESIQGESGAELSEDLMQCAMYFKYA